MMDRLKDLDHDKTDLKQLVFQNAVDNDVEPNWLDVLMTASSITENFYNWMSCTLSGPMNDLMKQLDVLLFPTTSSSPKSISRNEKAIEDDSQRVYKHDQTNQIAYHRNLSENYWDYEENQNFSKGSYKVGNENNKSNKPPKMIIEPEKDKPDVGQETQCYSYKSHALLTIHKVENIHKVIESSVTYGDFKLKGPGFRLENVRIPIRKGGDQIITIRFVTHDMKQDQCTPNKIINSVSEYCVEIPLSLVSDKVVKKWVILSQGGQIYRSYRKQDIMPEALYLMQTDDKNLRQTEPRISFSIWKCMQGLMEIHTGNKKSGSFKRVYVGYLDDPLDLAVSKILNDSPDILKRSIIEKGKKNGQYFIDGTPCILTLQETGDVLVREGGATQPLQDYMSGSTSNLVWDNVEPICAIDLVDQQLLPNLKSDSSALENSLSRSEAMALACHRAAIREKFAIDYLKLSGVEPPQSVYSQYLNPVRLQLSPYEPEKLVTYTWGNDFSNPRLIEISENNPSFCGEINESMHSSNMNSICSSNRHEINAELTNICHNSNPNFFQHYPNSNANSFHPSAQVLTGQDQQCFYINSNQITQKHTLGNENDGIYIPSYNGAEDPSVNYPNSNWNEGRRHLSACEMSYYPFDVSYSRDQSCMQN